MRTGGDGHYSAGRWADINMPDIIARRPYLSILALAAFLRTVWAVLVPVDPVSDAQAYHIFAINLAEHGVYGFAPEQPGAYWAVGTAAFYAALYTFFGTNFMIVAIANLMVGLGVVFLAGRVGEAYFGRRTGIVAAIIIALWPSLIFYTTVPASEQLFMVPLLAGLWVAESGRLQFWQRFLLVGVLFGLATYLRPIAQLVPIIICFSLWVRGKLSLKMAPAALALSYVMLIGLVLPWSLRNQDLFDRFVFVSTNFGPNLWMGNNPETTGRYQPLPSWTDGLGEIERADQLQTIAVDYIKAEPLTFLIRTLTKFIRLHERETIAVVWNEKGLQKAGLGVLSAPLKLLATGYWYLVLLAGLGGLAILARRNGLWAMVTLPPTLLWLYFSAIHAIVVYEDRYHFPSIPMLALLAAFLLCDRFWSHEIKDD